MASNVVDIEPESVSTIIKSNDASSEDKPHGKAIPASQWRVKEISALDVFSDSLKNVVSQDGEAIHNEQNEKYASQLEQILNPKPLGSIDSIKAPLKLETSEAFKQIMCNKPKSLGPNMLNELYEVKSYILQLHDAITSLISSKRKKDNDNLSDLDNFIKVASEMMHQDGTQARKPDIPHNALSAIELKSLTSAIKASSNDDSPAENREITTKANFKAEVKEEPSASAKHEISMQEDMDSLSFAQLQQRLAQANFISSANIQSSLPSSLSLDNIGSEVLFIENDEQEPLRVHFNDKLPSLSAVLSECLDKTEKSYIRHQNNNPQKFSADLQKALNDVLSNCQENRISSSAQELETKPPASQELSQASEEISESFDNVPVEIYENDIAFNSDEDEISEVVKGSDLVNIDFNSDNANNNKLVDGRPTAKTSFEAEQYLEDNLDLGKELQSGDFYDVVLKTDKWLQDICAANFNSLEYGCLIYSRREIEADNPNIWNLFISSDCRFVSKSPNFLNKIKKSFSLLKHQNIEINIIDVDGLPEQCPEYLARMALKKAEADAREELIENNALKIFIEHMGDDLRTVQISMHKQLPASVKEN